MSPFSRDLRKRVWSFVESGHSKTEAAVHFDVSDGFVKKLCARFRALGTLEPGHASGAKPKRNADSQQQLVQLVEQQPDATLKELPSQILEVCGVELSISGVDAEVKRLNLSLKKSRSTPRNRTGRTSLGRAACGN